MPKDFTFVRTVTRRTTSSWCKYLKRSQHLDEGSTCERVVMKFQESERAVRLDTPPEVAMKSLYWKKPMVIAVMQSPDVHSINLPPAYAMSWTGTEQPTSTTPHKV